MTFSPPAFASIAKEAYDTAAGFRDLVRNFVAEADASRLQVEAYSCAARAYNIIQWNGQEGVAIEAIVDSVGYVGCSIIQTGATLEDAVYRSIYDGRIEPQSYRTSPGMHPVDNVKSRIVWMHATDANTSWELGLGLRGEIVNGREAAEKLIGTYATDSSINRIRDFRRNQEVLAIANKLKSTTDDEAVFAEIAEHRANLISSATKKELLEQNLEISLAASQRLDAAAAAMDGWLATLNFAASLAQVVASLTPAVDPSVTEELSKSTNAEQAINTLKRENSHLLAQNVENKRQLQMLSRKMDGIVDLILIQARNKGAPAPAIRQPKWSDNGDRLELPNY